MIQDITPHHLYNEFTPRSPQNGDQTIGELVAELVTGYLCAKKKQHFEEKRKGLVNPKNLSREAYQELIRDHFPYRHGLSPTIHINEKRAGSFFSHRH